MKVSCYVPSALSQLPPTFVIRAIVLLTHAGLIAKCLYVRACRHAVRIAAWQHFRNKIRRISNLWLTTSRLRYPPSDYLVHWTKPLFSETSVFRFYSIFNCVPQFLYLPLLSFHSFYYISFYLVIFFRPDHTFSSYDQTETGFSNFVLFSFRYSYG